MSDPTSHASDLPDDEPLDDEQSGDPLDDDDSLLTSESSSDLVHAQDLDGTEHELIVDPEYVG